MCPPYIPPLRSSALTGSGQSKALPNLKLGLELKSILSQVMVDILEANIVFVMINLVMNKASPSTILADSPHLILVVKISSSSSPPTPP